MAKRIISDKQRAWLAGEVNAWRDQDIMKEDLASRILDQYESQAEISHRKRNKIVVTLLSLAALLIGLAALLLIGYNWQEMPPSLKLVIVFGVLLAVYASAIYLRFGRKHRLLSEVAFFLGCLFYGAGIFLVAQIFHLNAHYPDAFWWWALGILPFALCLDTLLLHTLLVAVLAIWCGTEILGFGNLGAWFFGRWNIIPNGAYTLPLLALPGFLWAYRKDSVRTLGLYVMLMTWWIILQPFAWDFDESAVLFIGAVGGLMLIVAQSHGAGNRYAEPYRIYGVLLSAGVLLILSFYDYNEDMLRTWSNPAGSGLILLIAVFSVAIILICALVRNAGSSESKALVSSVRDVVHRQWLPGGLVVLMVVLLLWNQSVGEPLLPTILANFGMVLLAIWMMRIGLVTDKGQTFAAGVLYFLAWAVVRYVDLFGDFGGMLGGALMFFLCGVVLFGLAYFWRGRREKLHD